MDRKMMRERPERRE
jgi:hypothetical protein